MTRRKIAVIGSGVSGITAGYVLSHTDYVTLFEAGPRLGGHADTHMVVPPAGPPIGVDTGFIVYNERTYPLLTKMFAELGVATQASEMSMSVRCAGCGLQYAGKRGLGGLTPGIRRGRGRYLRMLAEVPRFHRAARRLLAAPAAGAGRRPGPPSTTGTRRSASSSTRAAFPVTSRLTSPSRWSPRCGRARRGPRSAIRPATCSRSWPITGCWRLPGRRRGGP